MIIFLYGEDTFRSRKKLKELKEKFLREVDSGGSSLATVDGETATMAKINEVVSVPSLFSRKRLIIIEKALSNKSKVVQDQIHEYFKIAENKKNKKIPAAGKAKEQAGQDEKEDNIIIFWDELGSENLGANKLYKFLKKQKFAQEFKPLSNTEATNWVKNEVKARQAKISGQAALSLTSLFGNNLWQLSNELNKLINYKRGEKEKLINKDSGGEIGLSDIEKLSRGKADENIFALTDAISNKNKARALELLEKEIEAGITETYLMHMIIRQFRILLQIRQGLEEGLSSRKMINQLKLHPFVVQKSITQARNFSLDILKKKFNSLVNIDRQVKTGQTDMKTAVSLLIANS